MKKIIFLLLLTSCLSEAQIDKKKAFLLLSQNEQSLNVVEKINSFNSSPTTNKAFVQRVFDQYVIWSPINSEWAQFYTIQKEVSSTDDYFTSGYSTGLARYFEVRLPDATTGTFAGTNAGYTTQIGATATITFTGTGLDFFSYSDNTGGKWQYVLDGGSPVQFSVYAASAAYKKQTLFSGATYGTHTVVLTFLGADTSTVGTPFGWIGRGTSTTDQGAFAKCFYIVGSPSPNLCYKVQFGATVINPVIEMSGTDSGHKEMSFSVLAASGTTALINNWIPNHSANSKAAVFVNGIGTDRTLKVNGTGSNLFSTLTDIVGFAVGGETVELRQVYKGVNKDDLSLYLWDVVDLTRWSEDGMSYIQDWTSLEDHATSTAYISMFGVSSLFTHVITNDTEIDITASVIDQVIASNANLPLWDGNAFAISKTGSDLEKSYAFGFSVSNPASAMNLSENYNQRLTWTRNGVLRKLYPTIFVGYAMPSGVNFTWSAHYTMGFVPDAYNVLK